MSPLVPETVTNCGDVVGLNKTLARCSSSRGLSDVMRIVPTMLSSVGLIKRITKRYTEDL